MAELELRRLREEQGISQLGLARLTGVDASTINQVEMGRRDPSIGTLKRLAEGLGVAVGDLFPKDQPSLFQTVPQRRMPDVLRVHAWRERLDEPERETLRLTRIDPRVFDLLRAIQDGEVPEEDAFCVLGELLYGAWRDWREEEAEVKRANERAARGEGRELHGA